MTTKHTPEPWVVDEDGTVTQADSGAHIAVVSQEDDFPCLEEDEREEARAECKANARLIAAAPELLEALEKALRESGCDGDLCMHDWHDDARAALAKARGE